MTNLVEMIVAKYIVYFLWLQREFYQELDKQIKQIDT